MPTYEYECEACGHTFDEFQSMSDDLLTKCPQCGKKKLRRLFGAGSAVIFKGSGFYETDYRSDSYKTASKADKEAAAPAKAADTNGKTGAAETTAAAPAEKSTKASKKAPKSKD